MVRYPVPGWASRIGSWWGSLRVGEARLPSGRFRFLVGWGLVVAACQGEEAIRLEVVVEPDRVDLGVVDPLVGGVIGGAEPVEVFVVNPGRLPVDLQGLRLEGPDAAEVRLDDSDLPEVLGPGEVGRVTLEPTPAADALLGLHQVWLVVEGQGRQLVGGCEPTLVASGPVRVTVPIRWSVVDRCDSDRDGALDVTCGGTDCDDTDADIHPGATERCDGIDGDCDGGVDLEEADEDGDGWLACEGDCDDLDPERFPGAVEVCDGVDTDCNGFVAADESDLDGDGLLDCGT